MIRSHRFCRPIFKMLFNIWLFFFQVWGKMWNKESREMWGRAKNNLWRGPQENSNSNWRRYCLQGLWWRTWPWIHTRRSQDYWFHRIPKLSGCANYLMFNIWTHTCHILNENLIKTCIKYYLKTLELIWIRR